MAALCGNVAYCLRTVDRMVGPGPSTLHLWSQEWARQGQEAGIDKAFHSPRWN